MTCVVCVCLCLCLMTLILRLRRSLSVCFMSQSPQGMQTFLVPLVPRWFHWTQFSILYSARVCSPDAPLEFGDSDLVGMTHRTPLLYVVDLLLLQKFPPAREKLSLPRSNKYVVPHSVNSRYGACECWRSRPWRPGPYVSLSFRVSFIHVLLFSRFQALRVAEMYMCCLQCI